MKKQPSDFVTYKNWYEIKADGKILGVLFPSKQTEVEISRLKGLCGIECLPARPEKLIEINAMTRIPASLFNRWKRAYKKFIKQQSAGM